MGDKSLIPVSDWGAKPLSTSIVSGSGLESPFKSAFHTTVCLFLHVFVYLFAKLHSRNTLAIKRKYNKKNVISIS